MPAVKNLSQVVERISTGQNFYTDTKLNLSGFKVRHKDLDFWLEQAGINFDDQLGNRVLEEMSFPGLAEHRLSYFVIDHRVGRVLAAYPLYPNLADKTVFVDPNTARPAATVNKLIQVWLDMDQATRSELGIEYYA